jgi:hypothetical protein
MTHLLVKIPEDERHEIVSELQIDLTPPTQKQTEQGSGGFSQVILDSEKACRI